MTLGELLSRLPKNVNTDVRVVRNEKDISIAEGVTLEVLEVDPVDKHKLKVTVA